MKIGLSELISMSGEIENQHIYLSRVNWRKLVGILLEDRGIGLSTRTSAGIGMCTVLANCPLASKSRDRAE